MAVTAAQIVAVRERVPAAIADDPTVTARIETFAGDTDRAALSLLREFRAGLVAGTTQWSVAGDYSENRDGQLKALDSMIADLENRTGDTAGSLPVVTVGQMVRPGLSR